MKAVIKRCNPFDFYQILWLVKLHVKMCLIQVVIELLGTFMFLLSV